MRSPRLQLHLEVARRAKGLSQRQLGDLPAVRIEQSAISMFERGQALPVADQVRRLAAALGVPEGLLMQPVDIGATPEPEPADATATR